ncbi:MAG: hypothetical protein O2782_17310, partial [bacterium]|nr:hypothetical protein [bacterium]
MCELIGRVRASCPAYYNFGGATPEAAVADRDLPALQRLSKLLEIPLLAPETMMNDFELSQVWLQSRAVGMLRVGGSRDEIGKAIGLLNPAVPEQGSISAPDLPGWGAVWDRA